MNWIAIGDISDIPLRGARCVKTPQGKIAVFRTAENEVFAIEDHCPHKGGPLQPGHRSRHGGHLPAAQLGDLARNRQGARRRRGRSPDHRRAQRGRRALHRARKPDDGGGIDG